MRAELVGRPMASATQRDPAKVSAREEERPAAAPATVEQPGAVNPLGHRFGQVAVITSQRRSRIHGQPLPAPLRQKMERSYDSDFSAVRIHEGPEPVALGAAAYTRGDHVHFAPGYYQPASHDGQSLIGHELAHVVQQRSGRVARPAGKDASINADPGLEAEADRLGEQAAAGRLVNPATAAGPRLDGGMHASDSVVQLAPLRRFRRWLGRNTGIAIGHSGRLGRHERRNAQQPAQVAMAPAGANGQVQQAMLGDADAEVSYDLGLAGQPTEEQKQLHAQVWKQARAYHQVKFPDTAVDDSETRGETVIQSIRRQGLLTRYGGTGNSAQFRDEGYMAESRGKIHMGRDLSKLDVDTYGDTMLRPVLPRERTRYHRWSLEGPPGELYRDRDHPGYGVTTRQDIPPENIIFGSNRQLLQQHQSGERSAGTILANLASHYPGPQKPSEDYLRAVHEAAIDDGYISDEAGDNLEEEGR